MSWFQQPESDADDRGHVSPEEPEAGGMFSGGFSSFADVAKDIASVKASATILHADVKVRMNPMQMRKVDHSIAETYILDCALMEGWRDCSEHGGRGSQP